MLRAIGGWIAMSATIAIAAQAPAPPSGAARAQNPADSGRTGASRFALAIVSDPRGKVIVDLGADDFVVTEGKSGRDILDARVADYPVVVVFDNGRSAADDFAAIKAAVSRFVERLGPRPMALVTMGGVPQTIATFDDDREVVRRRLAAVEPVADGEGQPMRAAAQAARLIRQTGAFFSTIVIATESPVEVSGTAADEFVAPIIDSEAVVHVVAFDHTSDQTGVRLLRGLAQQTHGNFTPIFSGASFMPGMERFAARLTTEMLIEYMVPPGSKPDDPKIGVRIPGARVLGLGVAPR